MDDDNQGVGWLRYPTSPSMPAKWNMRDFVLPINLGRRYTGLHTDSRMIITSISNDNYFIVNKPCMLSSAISFVVFNRLRNAWQEQLIPSHELFSQEEINTAFPIGFYDSRSFAVIAFAHSMHGAFTWLFRFELTVKDGEDALIVCGRRTLRERATLPTNFYFQPGYPWYFEGDSELFEVTAENVEIYDQVPSSAICTIFHEGALYRLFRQENDQQFINTTELEIFPLPEGRCRRVPIAGRCPIINAHHTESVRCVSNGRSYPGLMIIVPSDGYPLVLDVVHAKWLTSHDSERTPPLQGVELGSIPSVAPGGEIFSLRLSAVDGYLEAVSLKPTTLWHFALRALHEHTKPRVLKRVKNSTISTDIELIEFIIEQNAQYEEKQSTQSDVHLLPECSLRHATRFAGSKLFIVATSRNTNGHVAVYDRLRRTWSQPILLPPFRLTTACPVALLGFTSDRTFSVLFEEKFVDIDEDQQNANAPPVYKFSQQISQYDFELSATATEVTVVDKKVFLDADRSFLDLLGYDARTHSYWFSTEDKWFSVSPEGCHKTRAFENRVPRDGHLFARGDYVYELQCASDDHCRVTAVRRSNMREGRTEELSIQVNNGESLLAVNDSDADHERMFGRLWNGQIVFPRVRGGPPCRIDLDSLTVLGDVGYTVEEEICGFDVTAEGEAFHSFKHEGEMHLSSRWLGVPPLFDLSLRVIHSHLSPQYDLSDADSVKTVDDFVTFVKS